MGTPDEWCPLCESRHAPGTPCARGRRAVSLSWEEAQWPPPRWPDALVFGPPLPDSAVRRVIGDRTVGCRPCGTRGSEERCWNCGRCGVKTED